MTCGLSPTFHSLEMFRDRSESSGIIARNRRAATQEMESDVNAGERGCAALRSPFFGAVPGAFAVVGSFEKALPLRIHPSETLALP
jgi:hypothetical protein